MSKKNFFDELPETFREDYVRQLLKENHHISNVIPNIVQHQDILERLVRYEADEVTKRLAERNPVEFIRYKKVISDTVFTLLFGTKEGVSPKVIDLLEAIITSKETDLRHLEVDGKELKESKVYQKLMNEHPQTH